MSIKETLKNTSIRGRFFLGMLCLGNSIEYLKISNMRLNGILYKMWEFIERSDLDRWAMEINEIRPDCILDDHPDAFDYFKTITHDGAIELKHLYNELPGEIIEIIDQVFIIGINNLYQGIVGYSEQTLIPTEKILEIMMRYKFPLPNNIFGIAGKFPFDEDGGWGKALKREEIQSWV